MNTNYNPLYQNPNNINQNNQMIYSRSNTTNMMGNQMMNSPMNQYMNMGQMNQNMMNKSQNMMNQNQIKMVVHQQMKNIYNQQMTQNMVNQNQIKMVVPQQMQNMMMNQNMPQIQQTNYINTIQNGNYKENKDLITESLISSGDYYKCTQNKDQLINQLNSFLNKIEIQNNSFKKNNAKDPVFDLIQNEEKKEVINFFNKTKDIYLMDLLNYLNSQRISINPNIASQIINSENGYQIYQKKIENLISIVTQKKKYFQIDYLTILVLGKSGAGKTTLINKILNINAKVGDGGFVTTETTPYRSNAMPFLRLVDTRGIELDINYGAQKLEQEASRFINEQLQTGDYNKFVHCIWYCVSGKRFEDVEILALNRIRSIYQGNKIPIIIVYTQSVDEKSIENMKKYIIGKIECNDFVKILAEDIKAVGNNLLKSFGIDELIEKTLSKCKEALNGDMRSVMTNLISSRIERELIIGNNKIKNYIFERTILKFIKGYEIQSDDNFLKYIITIYGHNTHYYLKQDISEQTSSLIKNGDSIRNHVINYINYYKQYVTSIISNELNTLAFKLLNIQAKIEKEQKMSTLLENKRDADDFIACNKQFFKDNFYCLAQKHFIGNFITNACEPLSKSFEDNFNQIVSQLLNTKEIRVKIDKCFWTKYQEFEEKLKKLSSILKNSKMSNHSTQKGSSFSNTSDSNAQNPYSDIKSVTTVMLNSDKNKDQVNLLKYNLSKK